MRHAAFKARDRPIFHQYRAHRAAARLQALDQPPARHPLPVRAHLFRVCDAGHRPIRHTQGQLAVRSAASAAAIRCTPAGTTPSLPPRNPHDFDPDRQCAPGQRRPRIRRRPALRRWPHRANRQRAGRTRRRNRHRRRRTPPAARDDRRPGAFPRTGHGIQGRHGHRVAPRRWPAASPATWTCPTPTPPTLQQRRARRQVPPRRADAAARTTASTSARATTTWRMSARSTHAPRPA